MTHGDLFTGIGGFSLAARWVGIKTLWQVDNNKFCINLLNKRFPDAKKYGDIKEVKGLEYVDIISGGFPCQPFSVAGKRKGRADDRSLWPEMFRIIQESKPAWVIGENVAGIVNMELDTVLSDLEGEGFETQTFIIPACGINAWHRRNRVWILAYSESNRHGGSTNKECRTDRRKFQQEEREGRAVGNKTEGCIGKRFIADPASGQYGLDPAEQKGRSKIDGHNTTITDTKGKRISKMAMEREQEQEDTNIIRQNRRFAPHSNRTGQFKYGRQITTKKKFNPLEYVSINVPNDANPRRTQQRKSKQVKTPNEGIKFGSWWQTEPAVGRVVHGLPHRVDRLRGLGNSIVPEIAYIFFEIIKQIESLN